MPRRFSMNQCRNAPMVICILLILFSAARSYSTLHLNISATYLGILMCGLLILEAFLCATKGKRLALKLDFVAKILLVRCVYYTFIAIYSVGEMSFYVAVLAGWLSYLFAINTDRNSNSIVKWAELISLILQLQTIVVSVKNLLSGVEMGQLKNELQIPYGGSNAIATVLLLLLPIIYNLESNRTCKNIFLSGTALAVLLSRSNSGMIVLSLLLLLILIEERKYRVLKVIAFALMGVGLVAIISRYSTGFFDRFVITVSDIFFGSGTKALNGRDLIFDSAIKIIKDNWLFGKGLSYREQMYDGYMTHNWLLEAMITGGIVAVILLVLALCALYKKFYQIGAKSKKEGKAFLLALLAVLVQGMVEPSLGAMRFDTIFWLFMGFGMHHQTNSDAILLKQQGR